MKNVTFNLYPVIVCCIMTLVIACGERVAKQGVQVQQGDSNKMQEELYSATGEFAGGPPDAHITAKIELSKRVLEKQLKAGASRYNEVTDIPNEAFNTDELEAARFYLASFLHNKGYVDIGKEAFAKKVKTIFGRAVPLVGDTAIFYVDLLSIGCSDKPVYQRNNGIDYHGFFVLTPENFITDFYYLPEIIDYRSEYPDLAKMEEELPGRFWSDVHQADLGMEKWSDLEKGTVHGNLEQRREFNKLLLWNRNRLLFNDDRGGLSWLLEHDRFFMESLVKRFGWTAQEDLLYEVLRKNNFVKTMPDDFGRLFWHMDCNGRLRVHANSFKVWQKHYLPQKASDFQGLLSDMQLYLEYLMGYAADKPLLPLTDEQRVEILANMVYFAEQYKYQKVGNGHASSDHRMMGRFRLMLNEQQMRILVRKHYFGLPKFKEWWDAADYDEYYVDGEYNGPWGRDNMPMTELEWRKSVLP